MASGAAFRGLAMPSFMENTVRQSGVIGAKGLFFGPIRPERKLPFTAARDMAAVAARLPSDASWSGQEEVAVLGPEDLSFDDQAAIISDVIGREVRYQQISFDQFNQQFLDRGASESFALAMSTCIAPRTKAWTTPRFAPRRTPCRQASGRSASKS